MGKYRLSMLYFVIHSLACSFPFFFFFVRFLPTNSDSFLFVSYSLSSALAFVSTYPPLLSDELDHLNRLLSRATNHFTLHHK